MNKADYEFEIGKSIELNLGDDVTIFCNGTMVHESLIAAEELKTKNISTRVVNMHTVKPVDTEAILRACKETRLIVSVEEHNIIGGLGSTISESMSMIKNSPLHLIKGINDQYTKGGDYKFLLEKNRLTSSSIVEDILKHLE